MYVRNFTPDDYQAVIVVRNAIYPEVPISLEEWLEIDEKRDPSCKHRRWVVQENGVIVGFAQYDQSIWEYHPQKFQVLVRVLPEYQARRIGSHLYEIVIEALEPFDPVELYCNAREDHPVALHWIRQRGFVEHLRQQWSELDVTKFDPTPFAGLEEKLTAEGIVIKTYVELASDPDRDRKLYDLDAAVLPDVPGSEDFTLQPFERWVTDVIESTTIRLDAFFVALDGEHYVGSTNLWGRQPSGMIHTGFTCARRKYRRRGIATALKVRAIRWAQANGYQTIQTDNEENNPMLQLNYKLGFQPTPAWVSFKKRIQAEA